METTLERSRETPPAHATDIDSLVQRLGTRFETGLSPEAAAERLARVGLNALVEQPPVALWRRLVAQFNELVVWILIGGAVIAAATGEWTDAGAILAIVLINGFLGFVQEERAGRALAALQKMSAPTSKVMRGGALTTIRAQELVPGDRIELEPGDSVPADARLVEAFSLRAEEAALTGESVAAEKEAAPPLATDTPLGSRRNVVHMGTLVVGGTASAIVVATGMMTELGRIAGLMQAHEREPTPLQRKLSQLGRVLLVACLAIAALVFVLELWRTGELGKVLLISVSLAVAAVPEGLPAVVTVALAVGLQRMVKRNALIRKLPSVETLGAVTVICSDKTGTLTRNEMTVREVYAEGRPVRVTGAGYAPQGELLDADGKRIDLHADPALALAATIAGRCNTARLEASSDTPGLWRVVGDPTEGALVVLARKAGVDLAEPIVSQIPFDSQRKAMSVVVRRPRDVLVMYTKGAPEVVLSKCVAEHSAAGPQPLTDERRREVLAEAAGMASRALRVLSVAYREAPEVDGGSYREEGLVFAGLVGMIDPPREEAKVAVARCREAGIRPVMITGDHPATALAIARELGIARGEDRALSGQELDRLSDEELAKQLDRVPVFARVTAEHKLRIVRAWKLRGEVVAMTGDGVNDAPAVRSADIGIAMGVTGTEVTKQASAMVLADDNFASIVNAVEEGRAIYDNIRKVVLYLLSCNAGEVMLILVAAILGWPVPLLAVQLLWINLVTDGLPSLGLVMERPERDIMQRAPRPPREPIITFRRALYLLAAGALVALVGGVGFQLTYGGEGQHLERARTVTFCVIAYAQLFLAFASRSHRLTLPQLGFFTNPHLLGAILVSGLLQLSAVTLPFSHGVFGTASHPVWEWAVVFGLALVPVTVIEVTKVVLATVASLSAGRAPAPAPAAGLP
jgi:Ca2+-transporting ATPase